jgi:hypothetical protein
VLPGGAMPTVEQTLGYILDRTYILKNSPNFHGTSFYKALAAIVDTLVINTNPYKCDAQTGYMSRVPNRYGFNVLVELVAYARQNHNTAPPQPQPVFTAQFPNAQQPMYAWLVGVANGHNKVRDETLCTINEGSKRETNANSPYMCKDGVGATGGDGVFARATRRCPCKAQGPCQADNTCTWRGAVDGNRGRCTPANNIGGRKSATFVDEGGRSWTDYLRGNHPVQTLVPTRAHMVGPMTQNMKVFNRLRVMPQQDPTFFPKVATHGANAQRAQALSTRRN